MVVEKPMGISTEWCERAIAARDKSGKKLIMYHSECSQGSCGLAEAET